MDTTVYNGYQHLLNLFKEAQRDSPRGVSLKRTQKGSSIYISLQITVGEKRRERACNCDFTQIGIVSALDKANKVADALGRFSSESDLWNWYDTAILEKNIVKNDLITFGDAIKLVENRYWSDRRKNGQKREKDSLNDITSWRVTYWRFYKDLPQDKTINIGDIRGVINSRQEGTNAYRESIHAFRRMIELTGNTRIKEDLEKFNTRQTEFRASQNISTEDFITMRQKVLSLGKPDDTSLRLQWMFVFSMQVIYGLRISEVFAVENIDKQYITSDGVKIPALSDPSNTDMVIAVGSKTVLNTTTKTGYRLAVPLIPPTHPNLIDILNIKAGVLPNVELDTNDPERLVKRISRQAFEVLSKWARQANFEKFTQTHALRHLANLNGMMAGMSLEKRAMSLGHSPEMNDKIYKSRQTTQTTLDILTQSSHQTIPLFSAIDVVKRLYEHDEIPDKIIALLATVYAINIEKIKNLL